MDRAGGEVHPQTFCPNAAARHGLKGQAPPTDEQLVVERRGVAREHDRSRHGAQERDQLAVIVVAEIMPVALGRSSGVDIGRVRVNERAGSRIVETGYIRSTILLDDFDVRRRREVGQRPRVDLDGNIPSCSRLAPKHGARSGEGVDEHVMRRHLRDDDFHRPAGGLRAEVRHSSTIGGGVYAVNLVP